MPLSKNDLSFDEQDLNEFISANSAKVIASNLVSFEGIPYWSFVLEYGIISSKSSGSSSNKKIPDGIPNARIMGSLKEWRKNKSEERNEPAYWVLTNRLAAYIAIAQPKTVEELLAIPGIGESKLNLYGEDILKIVSEFTDRVETEEEI
jgi:superfamily II DNA helicase RecQ